MVAIFNASGTEGGSSYTLHEISEDLAYAKFTDNELIRQDAGMHSVVAARAARVDAS